MPPLRKELFWDIDFAGMNPKTHKRIIIERVITLGNLAEFIFLLRTYTSRTLVSVIEQIGYLDPKTLNFVVSFYIKCQITA